MGADLYIEKMERNKQYTDWRTGVDVGYFRDSYNDSNLLNQLDLSYWTLDREHPEWFEEDEQFGNDNLTSTGARKLLKEIQSRRHMLEGTFVEWSDEGKDFKYFPEKFDDLVAFLTKAIELDSSIIWSV